MASGDAQEPRLTGVGQENKQIFFFTHVKITRTKVQWCYQRNSSKDKFLFFEKSFEVFLKYERTKVQWCYQYHGEHTAVSDGTGVFPFMFDNQVG